jgi:hypothetical protein
MLWSRALKGFFLFVVLVGLMLLFENMTITLRELGFIFIIIGGIGYVLARGALGFKRRALPDTVDARGQTGGK